MSNENINKALASVNNLNALGTSNDIGISVTVLSQTDASEKLDSAKHNRDMEKVAFTVWIRGFYSVITLCALIIGYGIVTGKDNLLLTPLALAGSLLAGVGAYMAGKKSK